MIVHFLYAICSINEAFFCLCLIVSIEDSTCLALAVAAVLAFGRLQALPPPRFSQGKDIFLSSKAPVLALRNTRPPCTM